MSEGGYDTRAAEFILQHEHRLEEIEKKGEEDRKLEDLKAKNALTLEEKKHENAKRIEKRKVVGSVCLKVLGVVLAVGTACFLDRHDFSRRNGYTPKE